MVSEKLGDGLISEEIIIGKIILVRGQKVMIDRDLAHLYGVDTKVLKQAVRRNIERFPEDFMFELTPEEHQNLRSQFVTSSWGGTRYRPMVFTEQRVAMLSSVLKSKLAIQVNIQIIRVFTKLRAALEAYKDILNRIEQLQQADSEQEEKILRLFEFLKRLEQKRKNEEDFRQRKRIGFKTDL